MAECACASLLLISLNHVPSVVFMDPKYYNKTIQRKLGYFICELEMSFSMQYVSVIYSID